MKTRRLFAACLLAGASSLAWAGPADDIRHGRYLVQIGGCNDCHTPGYMRFEGKVNEADWLTGDAMGWQGAWGTTYPANLRKLAHDLDEGVWVKRLRAPMRPPMPWFNLQAMSDADLLAIHRYLRSLGPKGEPAPAYVPPGGKVATPYFDFTPKNLPDVAKR
jgi:mono/diheme cytochrome c family protein